MRANRIDPCGGPDPARADRPLRRAPAWSRQVRWLAAGLLSVVAVCSPLSAGQAVPPPRFDPVAWFEGPLRSAGTSTLRWGQPRAFRVALVGRREGDVLLLSQRFVYADGKTLQRNWSMRRIGPGPDGSIRYDATGSDVIGVATGYASGDTFLWSYLLQRTPGNPLTRVRMDHRMRLSADGRTLSNRVRISRFGIPLGSVTETFLRSGAMISPAATTR